MACPFPFIMACPIPFVLARRLFDGRVTMRFGGFMHVSPPSMLQGLNGLQASIGVSSSASPSPASAVLDVGLRCALPKKACRAVGLTTPPSLLLSSSAPLASLGARTPSLTIGLAVGVFLRLQTSPLYIILLLLLLLLLLLSTYLSLRFIVQSRPLRSNCS